MTEPCYCCGELGQPVRHKATTYHLCADCTGGRFEHRNELVVFVCPEHGAQMPLDVDDASVHFPSKRTKAGGRYEYPVKTRNGATLFLLWYDERIYTPYKNEDVSEGR